MNYDQRNMTEKTLKDVLRKDRITPFIRKKTMVYLGLAIIAISLSLSFFSGDEEPALDFKTEDVTRGRLLVTVSATGNLKPTNQVEVGSELSGIISDVYVEENDLVKRGQVLAKLDTSQLKESVEKAQANLLDREASVEQANASVVEASTQLQRLRKLQEATNGELPSQTELDQAIATYRRALANHKSAEAQVRQAEASLSSDQTNLVKASIVSPIDGVILKRKIEIGQTVAASFQAPVLFVIAEDLTKMQLNVDVDEADVGKISSNQKAEFSVDAWPERTYDATIKRISFGAEEKDNVITYPTILEVQNQDLSLRPGMTGTALITVLELNDALIIPTSTLRLELNMDDIKPRQKKGVFGLLFPRSPQPEPKVHMTDTKGQSSVWVLKNGKPEMISVEILATNRRSAAVKSDQLSEGTKVIVEAASKNKKPND